MEGTAVLERLVAAVERIADRLDPPAADIVDSRWVADRLGCTTTWIAELVRAGELPRACVVQGTGNGKPWKFHRSKVEEWLAAR
jgi:excisionase family DNA binding protein